MNSRFWTFLMAAGLAFGLVACQTTKQTREVEPSGFMKDYSEFRDGKGKEAQLVYLKPDVDWKSYTKIIVDPVTIWYAGDSELDQIPRVELESMADHLEQAIKNSITNDYEIVTAPGPGVLRLRTAITDVKKSKVVMDTITTAIPQLRLISGGKKLATGTHAFVGRASIEAELLDASNGTRLGAGVDQRAGGKAFRGVTSKWADVEQSFDYWAERFVVRMKELRGDVDTEK